MTATTSGSLDLWAALRPDRDGLVAAVVQDVQTRAVLMLGYMNAEAFSATVRSKKVTFWSRSRNVLWRKGETSGNTLDLLELRADCDGDALLVLARPAGPTCHTGRSSCFYKRLDASALAWAAPDDGPTGGLSAPLDQLFSTIEARKTGRGMTQAQGQSYVRRLLSGGRSKVGEKLREEAAELADAVLAESDARVASEAADLVFHTLVALSLRDLTPEDVGAELKRRAGQSGVDEKASRPAP